MRKARILLIFGIWVAIIPFLGFPYSWKDILTTVSGVGFMFFSYILYKESKVKEGEGKVFDNFSENSGFVLNEDKNKNEVKAEAPEGEI